MEHLRFGLVALNAILFTGLLVSSVRHSQRESSFRVRRLWRTVAVVCGALVFGSTQRLVLQASELGWLSEAARDAAVTDWQLVQSVVVGGLAVGAFAGVRSVAVGMVATERVSGAIVDRVSHVDVAQLGFSNREREVLALIGEGLLTDAELADALHVSTSTVQSHVKSMLHKAGLNRRQDLIGVWFLVDSERRVD